MALAWTRVKRVLQRYLLGASPEGFQTRRVLRASRKAEQEAAWQELQLKPVFNTEEWLIGWKAASIGWTLGETKPKFLATTNPLSYHSQATARCRHTPYHVGMEYPCACGFYAFKRAEEVKLSLPYHVMLRVGLKNRYVEAYQGYRAGFQYVTNVWFNRSCLLCEGLAYGIRFSGISVRGDEVCMVGSPVCESCAKGMDLRVYSLEELGKLLECEAEWLLPSILSD